MRIQLFAMAAMLALGATTLHAQRVNTGILDFVSPDDGTVRLRCDQLGMRPVVFFGLNAANILGTNGSVLTVEDLSPGMSATFFYTRINKKRWVISKILVNEQEAYCGQPIGWCQGDYPPTRVVGRSGPWRRIP
ncbi:MAG: hypothetical protein JWL59_2120 [Chthoniobacteraceae bacterium]|nr:hypothetical protein [Chthoniobacteraceae bacterium]